MSFFEVLIVEYTAGQLVDVEEETILKIIFLTITTLNF
jgi:hypothetical protein